MIWICRVLYRSNSDLRGWFKTVKKSIGQPVVAACGVAPPITDQFNMPLDNGQSTIFVTKTKTNADGEVVITESRWDSACYKIT